MLVVEHQVPFWFLEFTLYLGLYTIALCISASNNQISVYLGITMDRTLSFKEHTRKLKAKIKSKNALLSKLANSKWGANPYTLRTTALALCFSTAGYACPVWERSAHAAKIDSALNNTCRRITGCFKPTPLNKVYSLVGINPPPPPQHSP